MVWTPPITASCAPEWSLVLNSRQRERPQWILRRLGLIWQRRCSRFTVLMVRGERYYGGSCAAGRCWRSSPEPSCLVGMEADEVRLIPPQYVRPFVNRWRVNRRWRNWLPSSKIPRWHARRLALWLSSSIPLRPGLGATLIQPGIATIGDGAQFRSGRQLSAWLGLVPRRSRSAGMAISGACSCMLLARRPTCWSPPSPRRLGMKPPSVSGPAVSVPQRKGRIHDCNVHT